MLEGRQESARSVQEKGVDYRVRGRRVTSSPGSRGGGRVDSVPGCFARSETHRRCVRKDQRASPTRDIVRGFGDRAISSSPQNSVVGDYDCSIPG